MFIAAATGKARIGSINDLPGELLQQIVEQVFTGSPNTSLAQGEYALEQLQNLARLNRAWKAACQDSIFAAGKALAVHQQKRGKGLAEALASLQALRPALQKPAWQALPGRAAAFGPHTLDLGVDQYLQQWPARVPPGSMPQAEWHGRRDACLAYFAAGVLPHASERMRDFLLLLGESRAPMDRLAAALLDVACDGLLSPSLAEAFDLHADTMPRYCRARFQAVQACMRHGKTQHLNLQTVLLMAQAMPQRLQWRMLVAMHAQFPQPRVDEGCCLGAPQQALVDAIGKLAPRYRVLALRRLHAPGWERLRTDMLLHCLPARPQEAAPHLEAYLAVFDSGRNLRAPAVFQILEPVRRHVFDMLGAHGTGACRSLLMHYDQRLALEETLRQDVLQQFKAHAEQLPPRDRMLIRLLVHGLFERAGEMRVLAFRMDLAQLLKHDAGLIAWVLCSLCDPQHGLSSCLFMSSLDTLDAVLKRLPEQLWMRVRNTLCELARGFVANDSALFGRTLGLHLRP
ncbi:hypothetical protein GT347_22735 [Xylophilus rhododendri]|uniref:Uncharacterized protein n=1 Tax=Xylophilus rhododendri TaxID=2697032 RepID=A0A857JBE9_9BURK|nr:hypothetical protein [Xylophilus rhododendri]QHJ00544.1 hypothetical protein GT347_22735 [Xylophilus rhododendri]